MEKHFTKSKLNCHMNRWLLYRYWRKMYWLNLNVMYCPRGCEIAIQNQAETNRIHCTLGCNIWGVNLDPSAIRINIKVISPQKEEQGVGKMSELKWMSSGVRDKSWTIMFLLSLLLIITQRLVAVARSKIFPQSEIFSNLRDLITSQRWMGGCDVDWE